MQVTIAINVWYDEATVQDRDALIFGLNQEIQRAIGEGLLTPTSDKTEVVDHYDLAFTEHDARETEEG